MTSPYLNRPLRTYEQYLRDTKQPKPTPKESKK